MKEKDAEQDNLGLDLLIPDYVLYFFIVYNFYFSSAIFNLTKFQVTYNQ